ncbi:unnamed protein product [Bursaphelenchus xylophilus]|nr:unnamed protein product [Bursaphelenchus xylophilus]CAG9122616.1 unnamed protein product [Bursaphelenchus xylophilus]
MKSVTLILLAALAFAAAQDLLPPGFAELLPAESKRKLLELHWDRHLTMEQRGVAIQQVFDKLPQDVLAKLPLPPGLERLPEEYKKKFRELRMDRSITASERVRRVKEMVSQLPEELQKVVRAPAGAAKVEPETFPDEQYATLF